MVEVRAMAPGSCHGTRSPRGRPHHPGPLLPASLPSAGRRGRSLSREFCMGSLLLHSPSLPAAGGRRGEKGVGGYEGRLRRSRRSHYLKVRNHVPKIFLTVGVSLPRRQVSAAFFTTSPWVG